LFLLRVELTDFFFFFTETRKEAARI